MDRVTNHDMVVLDVMVGARGGLALALLGPQGPRSDDLPEESGVVDVVALLKPILPAASVVVDSAWQRSMVFSVGALGVGVWGV